MWPRWRMLNTICAAVQYLRPGHMCCCARVRDIWEEAHSHTRDEGLHRWSTCSALGRDVLSGSLSPSEHHEVRWDEERNHLCHTGWICLSPPGLTPLLHSFSYSCRPPSPALTLSYLLDGLGAWDAGQPHVVLGLPAQDVELLPVDLHLKGVAPHYGHGWLHRTLAPGGCGGLRPLFGCLPHSKAREGDSEGTQRGQTRGQTDWQTQQPKWRRGKASLSPPSRPQTKSRETSPGNPARSPGRRGDAERAARCPRSRTPRAPSARHAPAAAPRSLARAAPKRRETCRPPPLPLGGDPRGRQGKGCGAHYESQHAKRGGAQGDAELCRARDAGSCSFREGVRQRRSCLRRRRRRRAASYGRGGRALPAPCLRPRGGGGRCRAEQRVMMGKRRAQRWGAAGPDERRRGAGGAGGGGRRRRRRRRRGGDGGCPEGKEPPRPWRLRTSWPTRCCWKPGRVRAEGGREEEEGRAEGGRGRGERGGEGPSPASHQRGFRSLLLSGCCRETPLPVPAKGPKDPRLLWKTPSLRPPATPASGNRPSADGFSVTFWGISVGSNLRVYSPEHLDLKIPLPPNTRF